MYKKSKKSKGGGKTKSKQREKKHFPAFYASTLVPFTTSVCQFLLFLRWRWMTPLASRWKHAYTFLLFLFTKPGEKSLLTLAYIVWSSSFCRKVTNWGGWGVRTRSSSACRHSNDPAGRGTSGFSPTRPEGVTGRRQKQAAARRGSSLIISCCGFLRISGWVSSLSAARTLGSKINSYTAHRQCFQV